MTERDAPVVTAVAARHPRGVRPRAGLRHLARHLRPEAHRPHRPPARLHRLRPGHPRSRPPARRIGRHRRHGRIGQGDGDRPGPAAARRSALLGLAGVRISTRVTHKVTERLARTWRTRSERRLVRCLTAARSLGESSRIVVVGDLHSVICPIFSRFPSGSLSSCGRAEPQTGRWWSAVRTGALFAPIVGKNVKVAPRQPRLPFDKRRIAVV